MVTLIGMGSGKWEALSAQAQQAVRCGTVGVGDCLPVSQTGGGVPGADTVKMRTTKKPLSQV